MAKTNKPEAEQPREDALAEEAAQVEEQAEAVEAAQERRATERQKASARKGVPRDSDTPSELPSRGGEKKYSVERLTQDSIGFLGVESHIVAGALHEVDKEYLTLDEAETLVNDWLNTEVISSAPAEVYEG